MPLIRSNIRCVGDGNRSSKYYTEVDKNGEDVLHRTLTLLERKSKRRLSAFLKKASAALLSLVEDCPPDALKRRRQLSAAKSTHTKNPFLVHVESTDGVAEDGNILHRLIELGRKRDVSEMPHLDYYSYNYSVDRSRACAMLVRAVVRRCPDAVTVQDLRGNTPLHLLVQISNDFLFRPCIEDKVWGSIWVETVGFVLSKCPAAGWIENHRGLTPGRLLACRFSTLFTDRAESLLTMRDRMGNTPLHSIAPWALLRFGHYKAVDDVRAMIKAFPQALRETNGNGDTPFETFAKYVLSGTNLGPVVSYVLDQDGTDSFAEQSWDILRVFVKAAHCGTADDPLADKVRNWSMPHACLSLPSCPETLMKIVVKAYPAKARQLDRRGNSPLHLVAANPGLRGETMAKIVSFLLHEAPIMAAAPNLEGHFPLHLAIASGKDWDSGVKGILDAAPEILYVRDPAGMYPVMLAACSGDKSCLATVFNLIRACPSLLL